MNVSGAGRSRGFSLAECTIAVLVLSTLSVVLVGVIPSTLMAMKTAENRAQAAAYTREILEQIACADLEKVLSTELARRVSNGTEFQLRLEVAPVCDDRGASLDPRRVLRAEVIVEWDESNNKHQTFVASTVLRRR